MFSKKGGEQTRRISHYLVLQRFNALAAFTAEHRIKEIGVRKVLGASVANIVFLLSKDFTRLVVAGHPDRLARGVYCLAALANPIDSLRYE
jgi:hypothetical protein